MSRIYFLGQVDYATFLTVLQVSAAHVYFTYPFVLSWSMLEAMAAGCALVASDTAPVREVVTGQNGLLVNFFDIDALAAAILDMLRHPGRYEAMRRLARRTIVETYEAKTCIKRWFDLMGV
jgi:glycosyltransferase involved in cell wall biosynthesis